MKQIIIRGIDMPLDADEKDIYNSVALKLGIMQYEINSVEIVRRSLVCNNANPPHYKYEVSVTLKDEALTVRFKHKFTLNDSDKSKYRISHVSFQKRPIIIGSGPAGLFSALVLAKAGACPIVIERGSAIEERIKKVDELRKQRILDPECNIQFGEGGAGTFSDGKLKYGKLDAKKKFVLDEFIRAGAPESIAYEDHAHIGTDILRQVIINIREEIISLGGEFHFDTRADSFTTHNDKLCSISCTSNIGEVCFDTDNAILAIGHSSRDTLRMLSLSGIALEQKAFGVGVRLEHPQQYINDLIYGMYSSDPRLPPASYHLVSHLANGRSVYSFCMCPGGEVVPATSDHGAVVTNGMSNSSRNGRNANSAMLVSVIPDDFGSPDPLSGVYFQQKLERAAFAAGGGDYSAPVQLLRDFMDDAESSSFGEVTPTYLPGTRFCRHDAYLPEFICYSLREAILDMDAWLPGFALGDAVLTGVETRSTSPVRILRTKSKEALGIAGLYPCGEGAGYAGGIMSAACDGIECAEAMIQKYSQCN